MLTKPRAKKRGRQHVGSLTRSLAWEYVKFNHPKIAESIKVIAYQECGLEPPKVNGSDPYMRELLKKVGRVR
jgi:hypothetical protein